MRVHFVHGWAFDGSMWQALAALLPGIVPSFANRGYFSETGDPPPPEPSVWITHSLGTLLALNDISAHCRALVAVSGFDRFCAADGTAGVAPRILDRMLSRFEAAPQKVVADFRQQCGCQEPFGPLDCASLRGDLLALRDMDCRAQAAALSIPLLSLHGSNDPILPENMRAQTLHGAGQGCHRQHPSAAHLLPIEDAAWCAMQISAFLDTVC